MLEVLQHLGGVLLLAAFLYFGIRYLKRRNAARPGGSGGTPPGGGGIER